MKYLRFIVTVPFFLHLLFAQNDINWADTFSTMIPEEMVLIRGGRFEMGINKEDLKEIEEMGRRRIGYIRGMVHLKRTKNRYTGRLFGEVIGNLQIMFLLGLLVVMDMLQVILVKVWDFVV